MFSENLKAARKRKHYTLDALANAYNRNFGGGLSKGTLSKYENGKQEPMINVVINLAKLLDVSLDFLIGSTSAETYKSIEDEFGLTERSINFIKSIRDTEEIETLNYLLENREFKSLLELINNYQKEFCNKETAQSSFEEFYSHLSNYLKAFYAIENVKDYEYLIFNTLLRKFEEVVGRLKEI